MALDRDAIEKKDFPIGRRGYEPEAVDEHLARLADAVAELQGAAQRPAGASLAAAASDQVRAILEAAERSAQDIERDAQQEAAQIRATAQEGARRVDAEAVERSREQVARVAQEASAMLQRVEAMEAEVASLMEALRAGAHRLTEDLALVQSSMGELFAAAGGPAPAPPAPAAEPEPFAPSATGAPVPDSGDGDVEGARLIALNMALNGQTREQTDRYLAEHFPLGDREALLDEVYASVGS